MRPDHQPLPPPGDLPAQSPDPRGLFEVFSAVDDGELRLQQGVDGVGLLAAELFAAFAGFTFVVLALPGRQDSSADPVLLGAGLVFLLAAMGFAMFEFFTYGPADVIFDRRAHSVRWLEVRVGPGLALTRVPHALPWPAVRARYECRRSREAAASHQLILEWGSVEAPQRLLAIDCRRQPSRPEEAWAAIRSYMAHGAGAAQTWRLRLPVQAPIRQAAWRQLQVLLPTRYGRDYRAAAAYSALQLGSSTTTLGAILGVVAVGMGFVIADYGSKTDLPTAAGRATHAILLTGSVVGGAALVAALWLLCTLLLGVNGHAVRHLRWRFRKPPLQP